jgi:hypothetical protein
MEVCEIQNQPPLFSPNPICDISADVRAFYGITRSKRDEDGNKIKSARAANLGSFFTTPFCEAAALKVF